MSTQTPSREDLRAFMFEASIPTLRLAAPSLAAFYLLLGVSYLYPPAPVEQLNMAVTAIAVSLVMFSVFLLIRIPRWHARIHTLVGIGGLAVILHAETLLLMSGDAENTLLFVLIQVVFGAVVLHRAWFIGLTAVLLFGWTFCLFTFGGDLVWARQGGALCFASVLSVVLHTVRWQSLGRLAALQALERRNRRLLGESAAAIQASEDRYRALVNLAPIAVVVQQESKVVFANPTAAHMFGGSEDALLGRPLIHRVHQDDRRQALKRWAGLTRRETVGPSEVRAVDFSGREIALEVQARVIRYADRPAILFLAQDITGKKQTERLTKAFVATVSHELRTPLTSLIGGLKLVLGGAVGEVDPMASSVLEVSLRNSERLKKLIDDLLDFERLQVGRLAFDFRTVDAMDVLRNSLRANEAYAEGHGIALVLVEEIPGALVNADVTRLEQIFSNLFSNAAKYASGSDVEVAVALVSDDSEVVISVRDHGPGIPEPFRPHVFERFRQADARDTRSHGGSGLGLSITRSLVERHAGRIWFDTSSEGTTFFVALPVLEVVQPVSEEAVALVAEEMRELSAVPTRTGSR